MRFEDLDARRRDLNGMSLALDISVISTQRSGQRRDTIAVPHLRRRVGLEG